VTVPCTFCEAPVDPEMPLTYQKVTGWEHPRMAGGTNALALREPHGVYACSTCIDKQRRGIPVGQESLL
jgi:hypothetical protein